MDRQRKIIFGIDLGTTYSCISYVDGNGQAVVLPNSMQSLTTPSVVLFDGSTRLVGERARKRAILSPEHVVEMVKRHMGEAHWRFIYRDEEYAPEEIASYILRKLARDAREALGVPVEDVVITCPAHFGIAQREATARAGEIAGLRVHEIINEPTAAAINYGLQSEGDQTALVYDLGGGTFDVTVIKIEQGAISVIATGGDHHLGGRNWDEAIVLYLASQWQKATGSDDDPLESPKTLQDLWLKAERVKWSLTRSLTVRTVIEHAGRQVQVTLSRKKFEELTESLLERTLLFTKLTLKDARKRGYHRLDHILLVGGSTRMPQIAARLEQELRVPLRSFEPDEAVARGAALYGYKLLLDHRLRRKLLELTDLPLERMRERPLDPGMLRQALQAVAREFGVRDLLVRQLAGTAIVNVTSHSFGIIATVDYGTPACREVIENLVLVNDPLPTMRVRTFGTIEADQQTVVLQIMENTQDTTLVEATDYTEEAEVGTVTLPLPPGLPARSPVEVTFALDRQGRLRVVGREKVGHTTVEATFEARGGLTQAELQRVKRRAGGVVIL